MPIFEYACSSCGKEFETLVRGSSPAPECPECHSTQLRKKLSAFATITSSAAATRNMAEACQSCDYPEGPGACGFN